jgi:ribonuclease G
MSKELIVSVNGREKKIAILENGKVTEFYIERGEGSQGIVGNIYKGRVMRVLPGMQSAFVDIGLERDAFLYVSDFFDEEEEYERIVVEKKKGEDAARIAQERIERARLERERQIEAAQERAEPVRAASLDEATAIAPVDEDFTVSGREDFADATSEDFADATSADVSAASGALQEDEAQGRGSRRRRRDRKSRETPASSAKTRKADSSFTAPTRGTETPVHTAEASARETFDTPFVAGASGFERVVDEEEMAADEGAMFKDARLQERIFDQIHAVEFDIEPTREAEVGALLSPSLARQSNLQRIADDEDVLLMRETETTPPPVAASIAAFDGFTDDEGAVKASAALERVSDEEAAAPFETAATEEPTTKRKRGRRARAAETTNEQNAPQTETAQNEAPPDETAARKRGRARRKAEPQETAAAESSSSSEKSARKRGRGRRDASNAAAREQVETARENDAASSSVQTSNERNADENEPLPDAEARLSKSPSHGEFARRGGRRRRSKRPNSNAPHETDNGADETNGVDGHDAEVFADKTTVEAAESAREQSRGGRRDGQEKRRGGAATITDLLREGQEILVQIAKEPISQKGARITSHIALPGRYLVYMPTIEHVGVSRKIESDSERARLRKLIQAIRSSEDVPSGGFIVRTAGIGISEEALRDDARYLVRTWRDIRRHAEKTKAPALVHRDLDLVQRILRDQLSDDFTAIRVDSEDEYLAIIEFVNRINPRLVSRVKLYTRDEPILEHYGVEAEIDKAIKPRVWLKSGGYLVINQTEALVAIDVNTGKFVGRGGSRLEDTITRTNLEAVEEIARQIRLRDLGGIIVLDLIDMEDRRNRQRVMQTLQEALKHDKSPTKVLSFNDFGLVIMTRKRVKQSLERTLCAPCPYCQGAGLVKSPQTICYEILEEARRLSRSQQGEHFKQVTLRVNPEIANTLRTTERDVLREVEAYLGAIDLTSDQRVHQEQFDFAFV